MQQMNNSRLTVSSQIVGPGQYQHRQANTSVNSMSFCFFRAEWNRSEVIAMTIHTMKKAEAVMDDSQVKMVTPVPVLWSS